MGVQRAEVKQQVHPLDVALICLASCVSFALWCQFLYALGYEFGDAAHLSLFEFALLPFCAHFVGGSRLASVAIGVIMAITGAFWAAYLHHIVIEALSGQRHIGHVLSISLIATIVAIKIGMAYACLLSRSFRAVLRDVRKQHAGGARFSSASFHAS
jgi:hypothetical protein